MRSFTSNDWNGRGHIHFCNFPWYTSNHQYNLHNHGNRENSIRLSWKPVWVCEPGLLSKMIINHVLIIWTFLSDIWSANNHSLVTCNFMVSCMGYFHLWFHVIDRFIANQTHWKYLNLTYSNPSIWSVSNNNSHNPRNRHVEKKVAN